MSEYYKIIKNWKYFNVHSVACWFSGFFRNWDSWCTLTPCAFIRQKIVGSERRQVKQVENKERHFQEVAKGKYARTCVCLTMFYAWLHFK